MKKEFTNPVAGASFIYINNDQGIINALNHSDYLVMLWNQGNNTIRLEIDGSAVFLKTHNILCLTYKQTIFFEQTANPDLIALAFNKAFYCIHTNDSEVSCNGFLFFGSNFNPIIELDEEEVDKLKTLTRVLEDEFGIKDQNQEEMLRILLKRFIIRCSRLARKQLGAESNDPDSMDLIRHFNVLVEEHFKLKKKVVDYASLLHKSPKTVSNIFGIYHDKTPLQIIHDRIFLESIRYLFYTDKSIKEISNDLGYAEPTQFSKFFKKHCGFAPLEYKNRYQKS